MPIRPENELLRLLDLATLDQLLQHARREHLHFGHRVFNSGDHVDRVYFPENGVISVIVGSALGQQTEAGLIGSEGVLGLVEACGSKVIAAECTVQSAGLFWSVRAEDCCRLSRTDPQFLSAVFREMEFQLIETRQAVLCRAHHPLLARLARWLLELSDRDPRPKRVLAMTQEYLAAMLAVQRTTVNAAARELQDEGLIRYSRGQIEIVQRAALDALACECRPILQTERRRILGDFRCEVPEETPSRVERLSS
jgi:CRP-like cAMP-binding protein